MTYSEIVKEQLTRWKESDDDQPQAISFSVMDQVFPPDYGPSDVQLITAALMNDFRSLPIRKSSYDKLKEFVKDWSVECYEDPIGQVVFIRKVSCGRGNHDWGPYKDWHNSEINMPVKICRKCRTAGTSEDP